MNLFVVPSKTHAHILLSTLRLLGSILEMAICWVLVLVIMASVGLILIPTVLMTALNHFYKPYLTEKTVVFHNAKFDMAFFEYHFHFKFPQFEDTMLLHYLVDENPRGTRTKTTRSKAYSLWRLRKANV